jgi:hypothetical protein
MLTTSNNKLRQVLLTGCVAALGLAWTATPTKAASFDEVINGGECLPYPPYNPAINQNTGLNWQYWLYGFNGMAFCHLRMTSDWQLQNLSYVLYNMTINGPTVTVRLCVDDGISLAVTCSAPRTEPPPGSLGGFVADWVAPPALPPYADSAYLQVNFPPNQVTLIQQIIPVWYK